MTVRLVNNQWLAGDQVTAQDLNDTFSATRKFGGTGADGALNISSGTTNINVGGARIYILNYTSLSITGTGKLTFSNPHANGTIVIIKVQGDVTLTSSQAPMLDCSGMGSAGGASVTGGPSGQNGNPGNTVTALGTFQISGGGPGSTSAGTASVTTAVVPTTGPTVGFLKYQFILPGSGGGSGYAFGNPGSAVSSSGGNGGGALVIECAGSWNFTTANGISVAGQNAPNNGSLGSGSAYTGSGGGGGGYFYGLYNILTANTGTINISGGAGIGGNTNRTPDSSTRYRGGAGASMYTNGSAPVGFAYNANSDMTTAGPTGAVGFSYVGQNVDFA